LESKEFPELWVAKRFTAVIKACFQIGFTGLRKNSRFVSGHRFSDAVSSQIRSPFSNRTPKTGFSTNLFSGCRKLKLLNERKKIITK
jgi:hypothetical protein